MRCKRISLIPGVLLTVALCLGLAGTAAAANPSLSNLTYQASTAAGGAAIHVQKVEGAAYLFLPSSADLHQLALTFDGAAPSPWRPGETSWWCPAGSPLT